MKKRFFYKRNLIPSIYRKGMTRNGSPSASELLNLYPLVLHMGFHTFVRTQLLTLHTTIHSYCFLLSTLSLFSYSHSRNFFDSIVHTVSCPGVHPHFQRNFATTTISTFSSPGQTSLWSHRKNGYSSCTSQLAIISFGFGTQITPLDLVQQQFLVKASRISALKVMTDFCLWR